MWSGSSVSQGRSTTRATSSPSRSRIASLPRCPFSRSYSWTRSAGVSSTSSTKTATERTVSGTSSTRGARRGVSRARMKPTRSAPASTATVDVLFARQPADLHERAGDQLGELRAGVRRPHERGADEDRVRARELRRCSLRACVDPALRDDDSVARDPRDELELRAPVDREAAEVARVHADDLRLERDRALELLRVVGFDERVQPEPSSLGEQRPCTRVVDVAEQDQRGVGARRLQLGEVGLLGEEALAQQRELRRCARGAEVVERAAEAVVDEHREGGCAVVGELRREQRRVGVAAELACRRRTSLDLGDRSEPGCRKGVAEPHAATTSREKATSCSSLAAAAPDSSASRA